MKTPRFNFTKPVLLLIAVGWWLASAPVAQAQSASGDFSRGITDSANIAGVITPPKSDGEAQTIFQGAKFLPAPKLSFARVVFADYVLLRRDFLELKGLSESQIDHWLVDQVGYIARSQAEQTVVNTPISIANVERESIRPNEYGRALLYRAMDPNNVQRQIGFLDVKGAGAKKPSQVTHGNGLATLGECVTDLIHEAVTREVMLDSNSGIKNVAAYAVLDAGFNVVHPDGSQSRAGLLVRQAHLRLGGNYPKHDRERISGLFKRYGIEIENNFQAHQGNWDFGHYVYEDATVLGPRYLPSFGVPMKEFGYDQTLAKAHPKKDFWYKSKLHRPWIYSHETADYISRSDTPAAKESIKNLLQNTVGVYRTQLSKSRGHRLTERRQALLNGAEDKDSYSQFTLDLQFLSKEADFVSIVEQVSTSRNFQEFITSSDVTLVQQVLSQLPEALISKMYLPLLVKLEDWMRQENFYLKAMALAIGVFRNRPGALVAPTGELSPQVFELFTEYRRPGWSTLPEDKARETLLYQFLISFEDLSPAGQLALSRIFEKVIVANDPILKLLLFHIVQKRREHLALFLQSTDLIRRIQMSEQSIPASTLAILNPIFVKIPSLVHRKIKLKIKADAGPSLETSVAYYQSESLIDPALLDEASVLDYLRAILNREKRLELHAMSAGEKLNPLSAIDGAMLCSLTRIGSPALAKVARDLLFKNFSRIQLRQLHHLLDSEAGRIDAEMLGRLFLAGLKEFSIATWAPAVTKYELVTLIAKTLIQAEKQTPGSNAIFDAYIESHFADAMHGYSLLEQMEKAELHGSQVQFIRGAYDKLMSRPRLSRLRSEYEKDSGGFSCRALFIGK